MKVLRVIRSMNPITGGVTEAVNQAALCFNDDINKMDVLCLDKPNESWVVDNNGYQIHALGEGRTAYGFHFGYLLWLFRNAKNYDVVVIDGLWQFLVLGGYILKVLNVPFCIFIHGMLSPYFNKNKLKYLKKLPFWFFIDGKVISLAKATIFTCDEEAKLAEKSFPYYRGISKISTHGIDAIDSCHEQLVGKFINDFKILRDKRFLLYLGRIHDIKGIDVLIDALSKVRDIPSDFMLAIAGPDSHGMKAKLSKQIDSLGLTDRVIWLGMLSSSDKWGAYYAAEAFILPSHQENFGIVVAEALSTSTPVLITNKVNIWREILVADAGFVENDDVYGIQRLLEKWFGLVESEKKLMNRKAKLCFINNFSIESATSDFEKVLLDVIGQGNGVANASD